MNAQLVSGIRHISVTFSQPSPDKQSISWLCSPRMTGESQIWFDIWTKVRCWAYWFLDDHKYLWSKVPTIFFFLSDLHITAKSDLSLINPAAERPFLMWTWCNDFKTARTTGNSKNIEQKTDLLQTLSAKRQLPRFKSLVLDYPLFKQNWSI